MMTTEEIAKKHGYKDAATAIKAIKRAQEWHQKYPNRQWPAHITKAHALVKDFQAEETQRITDVRKRLAKLSRNPRNFFGAIPEGSRFYRLRQRIRRRLKLYLPVDRMIAHFVQLLPDGTKARFDKCDTEGQRNVVEHFAPAVVALYGINENYNGAHIPAIARLVVYNAINGGACK